MIKFKPAISLWNRINQDFFWKLLLDARYDLEHSSAPSGHLAAIISAIANFSFCFAAAKFWQLGCLGDGAVPVADALEDILKSGLAFLGTLEPFACWQECCDGHLCLFQHPLTHQGQHWAQPGPQPAPDTPAQEDPGLNLSQSPQSPIMPQLTPFLAEEPKSHFRDSQFLLWACSTHKKSTAPQRSNQLQTAGETRMSNKYFSFHNRT